MNIHFSDVKKSYRGFTLDVGQLHIKTGETIKLFGNNGAGKTTFLRLILDLISADNGVVKIDEKNVAMHFEWKKNTGSFLDESFLLPFYNSIEYFNFLNDIYKRNLPEISEYINQLDGLFGEDFDLNKRIGTLSTGNKVKVGIAGVLLIKPKLLILDEPFANLDPRSKLNLIDILKSYKFKHPDTVIILSSHELDITNRISGRTIVLDRGRIVLDKSSNLIGTDDLEKVLSIAK